ncbi:hypothetical protein ACFLZD_01035 [Candidatus Neomarinimicrobiota bacterium]
MSNNIFSIFKLTQPSKTINQNIEKSIRKTDYILTYLLIAFSGIPFFTADNYIWPIAYILIAGLYIMKRGIKLDKFFILYMSLIVLIFVIQFFKFNFFDTKGLLTVLFKFSFPYLALVLIGRSFLTTYVRVIYIIVIISFLFYVPSIIVPGFENYLIDQIAPIFKQQPRLSSFYAYAPNFILYTVNPHGGVFYRNSGPFWEPGGYVCFLILALIFNIIINRTIFKRKNLIFFIAIITTFSTTGYIALIFLVIGYLIIQRKLINYLILLPVFVIISYISFTTLGFLKDKIILNYEKTITSNIETTARTRFVSTILDLKDIKDNPIIGKGRSFKTRHGISASEFSYLEHRNNGITGLTVRYGIPFFLFYFSLIFKSFKDILTIQMLPRIFAYFILMTIILLGSSQGLFEKPIFVGLTYLSLILSQKME